MNAQIFRSFKNPQKKFDVRQKVELEKFWKKFLAGGKIKAQKIKFKLKILVFQNFSNIPNPNSAKSYFTGSLLSINLSFESSS